MLQKATFLFDFAWNISLVLKMEVGTLLGMVGVVVSDESDDPTAVAVCDDGWIKAKPGFGARLQLCVFVLVSRLKR